MVVSSSTGVGSRLTFLGGSFFGVAVLGLYELVSPRRDLKADDISLGRWYGLVVVGIVDDAVSPALIAACSFGGYGLVFGVGGFSGLAGLGATAKEAAYVGGHAGWGKGRGEMADGWRVDGGWMAGGTADRTTR